MHKSILSAVLAAAISVPAFAAPVTDWKEVSKVIDSIPTAAGVTLKKRMANCKMTIHKTDSWMETRNVPWPQYGAKPGETVLKVVFDAPPVPKQPGPHKPNPPQLNIEAFWVFAGGKPEPLSSWATVLQKRPVPLGFDASNNC